MENEVSENLGHLYNIRVITTECFFTQNYYINNFVRCENVIQYQWIFQLGFSKFKSIIIFNP